PLARRRSGAREAARRRVVCGGSGGAHRIPGESMIRTLAASILLLAAATPALALEDADYAAAVTATAKGTLIPGYQALERATQDLQGSFDELCKQPSETSLDRARAQFAATA